MLSRMTKPAARSLFGSWKLALMALIVALMSLASGRDSVRDAFAASNTTADFSVQALVNGVPIKNGCDTALADFKCVVHPGGTFNVKVFLPGLPAGLPNPDLDGKAGYQGVAVHLDYSPGLTFKPASVLWTWPSCASPFDISLAGSAMIGCTKAGPANESTFSSAAIPLVSMDFNCPLAKGKYSITLVYGFDTGSKHNVFTGMLTGPTPMTDTLLIDEPGVPVTEATPLSETIIINCDNPLPTDVTGDGFVSGLDFFAVLADFGACKPGLC